MSVAHHNEDAILRVHFLSLKGEPSVFRFLCLIQLFCFLSLECGHVNRLISFDIVSPTRPSYGATHLNRHPSI